MADTMEKAGLPLLPYGTVYFRTSNPPPEDWERDCAQAAADGMNCLRISSVRAPFPGCDAAWGAPLALTDGRTLAGTVPARTITALRLAQEVTP